MLALLETSNEATRDGFILLRPVSSTVTTPDSDFESVSPAVGKMASEHLTTEVLLFKESYAGETGLFCLLGAA